MTRNTALPIAALLATLPIMLAAAPAQKSAGSGVTFPVNPASPSTAQQNVFIPPPQPSGDQRVCLLDKPTHRLICHTYDEWRALGIVRSAKDNLEAKTIE